MSLYESIYLFSGNITEKLAEDKIKLIQDIIEKNNGKILKKEYWGLRSLAYKINKNSKAHYFLINSETNIRVLNEIRDKLKVDDDYIRLLNLSIDSVDKNASHMYKKMMEDR